MGQLQEFKIPLIIPRKHKGAIEVVSSWSISCTELLDPLELGQFIVNCAKKTCDRGLLSYVTQLVVRQFKAQNVFVEVSFSYYLDRATPQFEHAIYMADCYCSLQYSQTYYNYSMGVVLPVIIKDITVRQGSLLFEVDEPSSIFFEDIIEHVQKYGGIRIYPVYSALDRESLVGVIDSGKAVLDYLHILKNSAQDKALGDRGRIVLKVRDVYNMYNLEYIDHWRK